MVNDCKVRFINCHRCPASPGNILFPIILPDHSYAGIQWSFHTSPGELYHIKLNLSHNIEQNQCRGEYHLLAEDLLTFIEDRTPFAIVPQKQINLEIRFKAQSLVTTFACLFPGGCNPNGNIVITPTFEIIVNPQEAQWGQGNQKSQLQELRPKELEKLVSENRKIFIAYVASDELFQEVCDYLSSSGRTRTTEILIVILGFCVQGNGLYFLRGAPGVFAYVHQENHSVCGLSHLKTLAKCLHDGGLKRSCYLGFLESSITCDRDPFGIWTYLGGKQVKLADLMECFSGSSNPEDHPESFNEWFKAGPGPACTKDWTGLPRETPVPWYHIVECCGALALVQKDFNSGGSGGSSGGALVQKAYRMTVTYHVGNIDIWAELTECLAAVVAVVSTEDLLVLVHLVDCTPNNIEIVTGSLRNMAISDWMITTGANCGMDLGGLMIHCDIMLRLDIQTEWILKLHTKTDPVWRKEMYTALAGNARTVHCNLDESKGIDDTVANVIIPKKHLHDCRKDKFNRKILQWYEKMYGWEMPPYFSAGTCFYIRWAPLKRFWREISIHSPFNTFALFKSGYVTNQRESYAHAWERLVSGYIPWNMTKESPRVAEYQAPPPRTWRFDGPSSEHPHQLPIIRKDLSNKLYTGHRIKWKWVDGGNNDDLLNYLSAMDYWIEDKTDPDVVFYSDPQTIPPSADVDGDGDGDGGGDGDDNFKDLFKILWLGSTSICEMDDGDEQSLLERLGYHKADLILVCYEVGSYLHHLRLPRIICLPPGLTKGIDPADMMLHNLLFNICSSAAFKVVQPTDIPVLTRPTTLSHPTTLSQVRQLTHTTTPRHMTHQVKSTQCKHIIIKVFCGKSKIGKIGHWGDYILAKNLKRELENLGHRVWIQLECDWEMECSLMVRDRYLYDTVIYFGGYNKYIPREGQVNILWLYSHPDMWDTERTNKQSVARLIDWDILWVASKKMCKKLRKKLSDEFNDRLSEGPEIHYLPQVFVNMQTITKWSKDYLEMERERRFGVTFIGNSRNVYRDSVKSILDGRMRLNIWGTGWKGVIPQKHIPNTKIKWTNNENLPRILGKSRVVINDHWPDMRDGGFISMKTFEFMAHKCFFISDDVQGMETTISKEAVTYKDSQDLLKKIKYYSSRPELRGYKVQKLHQDFLQIYREALEMLRRCL